MAEYYRQFAFIGSVLAGFACAFYGTLLGQPSAHRAAGWAAICAMAASVAFLVVTLATTFGAVYAAGLPAGTPMPARILAQLEPVSLAFLAGIALLLASFALGGWTRSRRLGVASTAVALAGVAAALWALRPFVVTHLPTGGPP